MVSVIFYIFSIETGVLTMGCKHRENIEKSRKIKESAEKNSLAIA